MLDVATFVLLSLAFQVSVLKICFAFLVMTSCCGDLVCQRCGNIVLSHLQGDIKTLHCSWTLERPGLRSGYRRVHELRPEDGD